ncbi:calmodulin-dependent protein kinase [Aureococcus anophagefferens]|nr:calmodulin-dependent protein kinase [Aureococcus anophagefferens]
MGGEFSSCLLCFDGDAGPYADSHRYTRFEDLQLDKELGHGARAAGAAETPPALPRAPTRARARFSTVRLAINRTNKDKFAVKVVHKNKLKKQDIDALHVGIISKLQHPHVVKYFDFTQDRSHYYIVLEVVAGGELFDRIVQRVYYSEKEARDLLADFGFATEAKKPMRELCGTPAYVAPEIIKEKPYGLEVDMWSCGVIVFILLGGYPPFDDSDGVAAMYATIKAGKYSFDDRYWGSVSPEAKSFIKSLLQLSTTDLKTTIENLKKWNARRKLKGGIKAIMAANRVEHAIHPNK